MKTTRMLLAALLLFTAGGAFAADKMAADEVAGVWETASGGYVQIYPQDDKWVGTIVGSNDGKARYDKKNPDEEKRGRRLLGVTFLNGLEYAGDGEFEGGTIYDPNSGKTYNAKATLKSHEALDIRGYIGFSLIGKTQTWHRIASDAEHVHQDQLHESAGSDSAASSDDDRSGDSK